MKDRIKKYIFTTYKFKLDKIRIKFPYNIHVLSYERGEGFDN